MKSTVSINVNATINPDVFVWKSFLLNKNDVIYEDLEWLADCPTAIFKL